MRSLRMKNKLNHLQIGKGFGMYKRNKEGPWCALRLLKFMDTHNEWDIYVVIRQREANAFSNASMDIR
jgi:hypothetical protein